MHTYCYQHKDKSIPRCNHKPRNRTGCRQATFEALADNYKLKQDFTINQNDTIDQVDKKSPRLAIHLPSVSFSITNKGTFINQLRYLKALEQLPYYIFIDKLEWQKNKNLTGADSDIVILKFDARVYVKDKK